MYLHVSLATKLGIAVCVVCVCACVCLSMCVTVYPCRQEVAPLPQFSLAFCLHSVLYTHTQSSNQPWETKTDPAARHKSYWFYYLLQWMIFLGQFLNLEMSSILIMIVKGFFKLLELRRGKLRGVKRRRRGESGWRRGRKWRFVCVWLWKKRVCDFSPWVRLNKDDTNGFNSLNYCPQIKLLLFGFPRWAENGNRQWWDLKFFLIHTLNNFQLLYEQFSSTYFHVPLFCFLWCNFQCAAFLRACSLIHS